MIEVLSFNYLPLLSKTTTTCWELNQSAQDIKKLLKHL